MGPQVNKQRGWGSAVESLPSMPEALGSIPSTQKRKSYVNSEEQQKNVPFDPSQE